MRELRSPVDAAVERLFGADLPTKPRLLGVLDGVLSGVISRERS